MLQTHNFLLTYFPFSMINPKCKENKTNTSVSKENGVIEVNVRKYKNSLSFESQNQVVIRFLKLKIDEVYLIFSLS